MKELMFAFFAAGFLLASSPDVAHAAERKLASAASGQMSDILDRAEGLAALRTVVIAQNGTIVAERGYRGHAVTDPTNIKSASKSIISALAGIAIHKGILDGVDQKIAPILRDALPQNPDPRIEEITIGHLLSMRAGLDRTSGPNYGRWIASEDWVRTALAQPFVDEPGGGMLYSTGSTHLLSAILTRESGRSTLDLAREWLGAVDAFSIAGWERDPQGVYLGGNQMSMSAKSLLSFGELYRNGGRSAEGQQIIAPEWIEQSWRPRTSSRFTGDGYGYGWFLRRIGGHDVRYGWGYGGQMLYVVPSLELTVVMTSDPDSPAARTGHRADLHRVMGEIIQAAEENAGGRS